MFGDCPTKGALRAAKWMEIRPGPARVTPESRGLRPSTEVPRRGFAQRHVEHAHKLGASSSLRRTAGRMRSGRW